MWRGFFILMLVCGPALADIRVATWNAELSRKGPGLLLSDIRKGDPQIAAARAVIAALDADVLLLTDVDYDLELVALRALDLGYPHIFALRPNTGMPTGLDIDGDGRRGGPRDAQGYGWFAGDGGMAVLSRFPLGEARDFSAFLWRDLPDAMAGGVEEGQRLSTTAHWDVPVLTPDGPLHLLAWHATPPVFDGPEDRNGRRNHDEAVFWRHLIDGALPFAPPPAPFVVLGDANADPARGDGIREGIASLLRHPQVQDVHDAATATYAATGDLRVDYVLPSTSLTVIAAGTGDANDASRHRPVWVDLRLP